MRKYINEYFIIPHKNGISPGVAPNIIPRTLIIIKIILTAMNPKGIRTEPALKNVPILGVESVKDMKFPNLTAALNMM